MFDSHVIGTFIPAKVDPLEIIRRKGCRCKLTTVKFKHLRALDPLVSDHSTATHPPS